MPLKQILLHFARSWRTQRSRTDGVSMSEKFVPIEVNANIDKRARRTRELLAEALLTLGAENALDDLAVGDFAGEAGVSRSTFYQHFASKDDFLVKSWIALLDAIEVAYAKHYPDRLDIIASRPLFEHVAAAGDFVRSLVHSEIYPRQMAAGEEKLRDIAEANLRRRMPHWRKQRCRETAIYIAGGFVGLLRWWMESELKRSPEEMQAAFERLSASALAPEN
jgi:AcrR family transcriptional regulator